MKFFWLFGHQFGIQFWIYGFKWIETPNWRLAGTIYLGICKLAW